MIDNFALGLTHGLLLLTAWRLLFRPDLDEDGAVPAPRPAFRAKQAAKAEEPPVA